MNKGYEILAQNGDYRLVSDPECHWHIQCISTAAWYTEASGGLFDDSQTRGKYLELVAQHFPEHVEESSYVMEEDDPLVQKAYRKKCQECGSTIDSDDFPMDFEDTITLCIECYLQDLDQ